MKCPGAGLGCQEVTLDAADVTLCALTPKDQAPIRTKTRPQGCGSDPALDQSLNKTIHAFWPRAAWPVTPLLLHPHSLDNVTSVAPCKQNTPSS